MEKVVSFIAHDNYVLALKFTADNQMLVSGGMASTPWRKCAYSLSGRGQETGPSNICRSI